MKQDTIFLNSTLTSPKIKIEVPIKIYVYNKFNDLSIIKNTDDADLMVKISITLDRLE